MNDTRFDEIMDGWLDDAIGTAPDLRPPDALRQQVRARRRPTRWRRLSLAVGLAAAAAIAAILWLPDLVSLFTSQPRPLVASREWIASADTEVTGPMPGRLSRGGPKGGPLVDFAVLQHHAAGSRRIAGTSLLGREVPEIAIAGDDDYRLVVHAPQDLYLRVYQTVGESDLQRLYPETGDGRLPAAAWLFVPSEPRWFYRGPVTGEDRLFVVASRRAPTEIDQLEARRLAAADEDARRALTGQLREAIVRLGAARDGSVLEVRLAPR